MSVRFWLRLTFLILFLVAALLYSKLPVTRDAGTFPLEIPTPYLHYAPSAPALGRILVAHGLDASKEIMNLLCYGLAESGFDVYSIDLPGHGDSPIPFNGVTVLRAVSDVLDRLGPGTIVVGHSMGAAAFLDLASERPFDAMVLLSPAPTPLDRVRANRVLVLTGQFDLPRVREFAPQLDDLGLASTEFRTVPWAGHSGYVWRPGSVQDIAQWLGGNGTKVQTTRRLALLAAMMFGALGFGICCTPGRNVAPQSIHAPSVVVSYVAAAAVACIALWAVPVMRWLHLFAADYFVGFLLLSGLALLCLHRPRMPFTAAPLLRGGLIAAYTIAVPGMLVSAQFVHLSLTDGRWWRFLAIGAALLPLFIADEVLVRPIRPLWRGALVAVVTRVLIGAGIVVGVMIFNRENALLILITHLLVLFWIGLWFAGEWVRRHTQDALATAAFGALIFAWVCAAVFITA